MGNGWHRFASAFGLIERTVEPIPPASTVTPPSRSSTVPVTAREAVATLPSVYRALQIIASSASQLALDVERNGYRLAAVPSIINKPDVSMSQGDWVELAVMSLATTGKLFVYAPTAPTGERLDLNILPPNEVHIVQERDDRGIMRLRGFDYAGRRYSTEEILYAPLIRLPGDHNGIGPIQAARDGLTSAKAQRDYMAAWFDNAGQPAGVLSSDQPLTAADALTARNRWNGLADDGSRLDDVGNPSRVKVLGKGLSYKPLFLSPKDALWLEAQGFTRLEVTHLLGVPGSLMMVAPEGGSRSYANVEQEWIGFTRFTLTWYLGKLESLLERVTARGQRPRFRIETLLRSDTLARYQAHQLAINNGWQTPAEVRAIENLAPHAAIADVPINQPAPSPAPNLEESPA